FSLVYEGDEHMGLSSTCFIGGANSVVGNIWPVADASAAIFTTYFYDNYFAGSASAEAVTQAQRWMIEQEEELESWAGFICVGVP
ncbi:MAG: CHAT domain-containing protein, partial [Nitrososphaera sp.]|nr:CHAT domain-containing protein [Nitrososphaera sp.]